MAIDLSAHAGFRDYLDSLEPESIRKKLRGEFATEPLPDPFPGPTVTEVMAEMRKAKEAMALPTVPLSEWGVEVDMFGRPRDTGKAWEPVAISTTGISPIGIEPMTSTMTMPVYNRISPDMFRRLRTTARLQKYRMEGDPDYRVRMITNEMQKLGSKLMADLMENGAVKVVENSVSMTDEVELSLTISTALVKDGVVFAVANKSPVKSEPPEPKSSKPKTEIDEEGNVSISMAEFKALKKAKEELDELLSSLGAGTPSSIQADK